MIGNDIIIEIESQDEIVIETRPVVVNIEMTPEGKDGKDGKTPELIWGTIVGTLSDQTDLKDALDAKKDSSELGDLAELDAVDYTSDKLTNKPTLGNLADHDTIDYETELTNKPTLGDLADHNTVDYETEITNKPTLGDLSSMDTIDYTENYLTNKPILGDLASQNSIDYEGSYLTNKPTLGNLADHDTIDYETELTNKPTLGDLSALDVIDYTSNKLTNKPTLGSLADQDTVDYETEVTNKPELGALAALDTIDYTSNKLTNKPTLGSLADQDTVDYETEVTNKPMLGDLADHDTVDYETEITNKPELGYLAFKNTADYDNDVTNKPEFGNLATMNTIDYTSNVITNKPTLGNLADHDTIDYETELTNKPTLGDLSELDSISYNSVYISDKPNLGTMSAVNDAPSDGKEYVRKNGSWNQATGGAPDWGDIGGTLSDQTDLQGALDAKADISDLGDLAEKDTVDYTTDISNLPTLGNLAAKNTVDWDTDIDDIPSTFPPSGHEHDDRYYTETETDSLLSVKANTADLGNLATQDAVDYETDITNKPTLGTLATQNSVDWDTDITDIPSTFPPSVHVHDDRYYTETETDTLLSAKADEADLGDLATKDTVDYTTDVTNKPTLGDLAAMNTLDYSSNYLTNKPTLGSLAAKDTVDWDTDIDDIPSTFPPSSHTHDDRYYTETEIDTLLSAKANSADLGDLAVKDTVDWDTDITDIPSTFPPSTHTHDDRYYTETETDTLLSAKANTADLGNLASQDTVDYSTDVTNKPTLGDLAALDTIDYTGNYITNKPTLGTMAAVDDAASDNEEYVRKNGAWAVASGGGGSPEWGNIGGTLADQTDLQSALDDKADASDLSDYLPLSGGTMTGDINSTNHAFYTIRTDINSTATSLGSNAYAVPYAVKDSNDGFVSYWQTVQYTSGEIALQLSARKKVSGSNVDNRLDLYVDKNGKRSVSVSDATAWLNALGLSDSGWSSLTNSSVFTGTIQYRKIGKYVILRIYGVNLKTTLSSTSARLLTTLPSGYRPPDNVALSVASAIVGASGSAIIVGSNGEINLYKNRGQTSISTDANIHGTIMFMIA